mgnify:CR=1 FL=1
MPAFNEESNIADAVSATEGYADAVLVVDDGSEDNTASIASTLGAIVVKHESNGGYGAALQTIFSTAKKLDVEELVIIDSDGQHNPGDIPRLLTELRKGNDIIIGSRFKDYDGVGIPLYRKIGMKVLDIATRIAGSELEVTDTQCGFRAYSKMAINKIHIGSEGMSAGSEILIQASLHHLKIAEVPVIVRYDLQDTSSENPIMHGVGVLFDLVNLTRINKPNAFFGIPGALSIMLGLFTGLYAVAYYLGVGHLSYVLSIGSLLALLLGSMLIVWGSIRKPTIQNAQNGTQKVDWGPSEALSNSTSSSKAPISPPRVVDQNKEFIRASDAFSDEIQGIKSD